MPIRPGKSETEDQFISRCMSEESESFPDEPQRYAVCKSMYDRETMSKIKDTKTKVMARVAYDSKWEGINLMAEEGGLEDACWSGYIAIGTKDLNGRSVPNCVPIEAELETFEKEVNLADYPWDECIADMTARYESEDAAKRVCGYIKSQYGE